MREIDVLARGVHDKREASAIAGARHHQIVDHAALGVHELGVADAPRLEAQDIGRRQRLDGRRRRLEIRAREPRLAHMRNVEQPGGDAHMIVLFDDARRILQRHLVAREGNELRAQLAVQRVQGRQPQLFAGMVCGLRLAHHGPVTLRHSACAALCPLCHGT